MFAIPKSDALDVLLFGIGLRITQLAKMGDPKFKSLLDNRNFTIQMGSTEQDIYRTFTVENGRFTQSEGKTDNPTLSIDFKDSMTGAKLLTKGDATAFMMGVQNGDVKMSGDYSLLMWFNQIAKHIIPKIPEPLQPAVDAAKPIISKATPMAKDLCDKGMALLAGLGLFGTNAKAADEKDTDEKSEKEKSDDKTDSKTVADQDNKEKTNDTTDAENKSFVDTAKEKLADIKAEVEEKVGELKEKFDDVTETAKDKFAEVKSEAETKVEEVKEKAEGLTTQAKEKMDEVKAEAKDKVEEVKSDVQTKLDEAKSEIKDKADDIKKDVTDKVETAKDKADNITTDTKEKLADVKADAKQTLDDAKSEVKDKVENTTDNTQSQFDELKAKAESDKDADNLTPAQQKSHELEEKHADEEVIADNVKTQAVQDDKSPITNISVTRTSDSK